MPSDNDQAPATRADVTASETLLRRELGEAKTELRQGIATAENRIITLLTDFKESLEREMRSGFAASTSVLTPKLRAWIVTEVNPPVLDFSPNGVQPRFPAGSQHLALFILTRSPRFATNK